MKKVVFVLLVISKCIYTVNCSSSCTDSLGHRGCVLLPPDDKCGMVRSAPKVVGGHDAELGQFPWTALVYATSSTVLRKLETHLTPGNRFKWRGSSLEKITRRLFKSPICGGSIISDRFIVTAAHCCDIDADKKIVSVRVGEHDLESRKDCVAGRCATAPQDITVESHVVHEKYDPDRLTHDICLIRLKWPVSYNDFVVPICLPTSIYLLNKNYEGTSLEVAAWGIMHVNGNPVKAKVLQTASLPVLPLKECLKFYGRRVWLSPKLCAGGVEGTDTCMGDSGGPLMGLFNATAGLSHKYYLIGIVSYGTPKCTGSIPGIYVNVPKYVEWILNKMSMF